MSRQAFAFSLAADTCKKSALCWFEAHPGTASWLQGAGTLVALAVALGAYFRYRGEGFRPRIQAWCNPDGKLAVLLLTNLGRASGEVDDVLAGQVSRWKRTLKHGYRPGVRPHRRGQSPPCDVGPGESVRLLLTAGRLLFTEKSLRINVVLGREVKKVRVKRLSRGRINEDQYADPEPESSGRTGPADGAADPGAIWDATRRELEVISDLYHSGHLSRLDLWVGRYRSLRRAQGAGPVAAGRTRRPGLF